jgi:UDP-glucose 4-epimerase
MVVPNLVGQAVRGEPLTVYGDGVQSRCFSFVGDVVPAMVALIEHEEAYGEAFNLGGEREISIAELAELVIDIVGSDSQITYVPYDEAYGEGYEDMRRRVPDNTRAKAAVGFAPVTPLEAVVRLVAEDVRTRAAADVAAGLDSALDAAADAAAATDADVAAASAAGPRTAVV